MPNSNSLTPPKAAHTDIDKASIRRRIGSYYRADMERRDFPEVVLHSALSHEENDPTTSKFRAVGDRALWTPSSHSKFPQSGQKRDSQTRQPSLQST